MKKFIIMGLLSLTVLSNMVPTKAFEWSDMSTFYLCWYEKSDSTICRNLTNLRNSIVTYGNSTKPWTTSDATRIQDTWFDLIDSDSINVMVKYVFNSSQVPVISVDPYLCKTVPPIYHG